MSVYENFKVEFQATAILPFHAHYEPVLKPGKWDTGID